MMKLPRFGFNRDSCDEYNGSDVTDNGSTEQIKGLSNLYIPEEASGTSTASAPDIVDTLLQIGAIDTQQFQQLRQQQALQPAGQIEQILKESAFLTEQQILTAKARMYGLEYRQIAPDSIDKTLIEQLNLEMDFITSNSICPVTTEDNNLIVATNDPANIFAIEDIKRRTRLDVQIVVCSSQDIEAICEAVREEAIDYNVDDIISDMTDVEVVEDVQRDFEDLERMAGQSPVIKFVNYLISNAINSGASDIHIEPKDKNTKIRYRIDGVLFETMTCPAKMHPAVVSRIKIMANLDISERRLPQDGKVSVIVGGRAIDLRISVLPTNRGEKVVIRILDSKSIMRGLEDLGMDNAILEKFRAQIAMPNGIFLVTGPTGSGKSTTLYSALSQMDGDRMNISTVEDPVEYELDFCNQVQANERIGLDFASALRSLLRQDPDIIMIGEIRDQETAKIAVQAALTGHLVLSTLHTNDAASSITRLVDIGIDSYLIAASLNGVLAQRLVRRICPKCHQPYHVPESMKQYIKRAGINSRKLHHGVGCEHCRNSGYAGRVGIYEMLIVDDAIREMINRDCSVGAMRQAFHASGAGSLFDDGLNKVKTGQTTLEEVLRVTEACGDTPVEEVASTDRPDRPRKSPKSNKNIQGYSN
ncbi:MAG: GspE/PulE family protein [Phycisphaerales bacterium]|jgi:type IV pilus assembly protein PilB